MGLIEDLDYRIAPQSRLQRAMNRVAGTWPMPRLLAPIIPRLDRVVSRSTDGRGSVTSLGGQQVLWVGVRGKRTGKLHQVPLLAFPIEDDLAVIGSNFGRPDHPAWAHNLWANPDVELRIDERTAEARAREATPVEAEEVWRAATAILPGYGGYRKRVTNRTIPVFVFERRPGPEAA